MRLFRNVASWRSFILGTTVLLSSSVSVSGKKDAPSISTTKFGFMPRNLQYFDDSDVLMFEDGLDHVVYRSENAGESWAKVAQVPEDKEWEMIMHPYDNQRAYIFTGTKSHWMTGDRGKTWTEFTTDAQASAFRPALAFHAADPDRMIFNGMHCGGVFCDEVTLYTTSGFSKGTNVLRTDTAGCYWAKSSDLFTTGQKDLDNNRILCISKGRFSPWRSDYRLMISDDFFQSSDHTVQEFEPELEPSRTVQGIVNMAVVKKFLIVAATAANTDEMALYISNDTIRWHRAVFPHDHKLQEEAYTILESTDYSIQVDILNTRPSNPMGVFLSSNSNGTYFTRNIEHTNRGPYGFVDFEKMSGVQGIVLVNTVKNWEDVEKGNSEKKLQSQISFDDGRTWQSLKHGSDNLHVHSVTELSNSGRVFSSPAPGLVMGIGNTGDHLKGYKDGDLYVSDDAGVSWDKALDGPHLYEFGDQGSILVAIKDGMTDKISYSLNHGKDWKEVDLEQKIRPAQLTTTSDSTSLKFMLIATDEKAENPHAYVIAIDFDDLHESQCKDSDIEEWFARVDEKGEPTCIMGHTQSYMRRKADADCFMKQEFKDPKVRTKPCKCTIDDFECDYNFLRSTDRKECKRAGAYVIPEGACKAFGPDDTFKGSSGWRLIPGNDCERETGKQQDDLVDVKCEVAAGTPASGDIGNGLQTFPGSHFKNLVYLERTGLSAGDDETVVIRTEDGVFLTHNHGKKWEQILRDEKIIAVYPHPFFNDVVFFLTPTEKVFYSVDRGENIRSFKAPHKPNTENVPIMTFHPKHKEWIIWTGAKDCESKEGCHSVASITLDRGDDGWKTLRRYVRRCEFIREATNQKVSDENEANRRQRLIYCEVRANENNDPGNPWQLVSSYDFFREEPEVHFKNVVEFATMSEFIVVATKDEEHKTLKVDASVDGSTFADAKFPHGFSVDHQQGYTVMDSSTHSIFLHVTVENDRDFEYGTIIKSNSNGTTYVLSLDGVNRDSVGYVDFEKTQGIEGVAMANVVANCKSSNYKKEGKRLKSLITHNDGAEWDYIPPPAADPDGKKYGCAGSLDKCALHIHGYTEREDKSRTYSSPSAIGLMIVTGNVGEYLAPMKDADTFMTADAGLTWKVVKKGIFLWAFGDQGSIVVIVKGDAPTKVVHYSLDEGANWHDHEFSDHEIRIDDISTLPSDNSRNFLLWGRDDGKLMTLNVDFTGLTDNQCKLDENDVEGGDYYLWRPKHPKQNDDCLFGHVSQYHRKRTDRNCFNGRMIPHLHDIAKNCSCSRRDFECDYNYERQVDGSCALVPGLPPPDHSQICRADSSAIEYFEPTGYRRIPLTTCEGGREMDVSVAHPCAGHDDEFQRKRGASAIGIFFAVTVPFAAAFAVGWYVWRNGAGKWGQIRLGEQPLEGEAPYIKYPVIVLAALVAVAQALPLLASSLLRSLSGVLSRGSGQRFTTRDSFARGRGDYAVVDEDEGELLGDDSDEEV